MRFARSITTAILTSLLMIGALATQAAAGDIRTVWVLSDSPQSLSLQFNGRTLESWDPAWQRTGRGYMTQISFPTDLVFRYQDLLLIRADQKGWSRWHPEHTQFLRYSNVGKGDPACVGGKAWCAVRGL